MPRPARLLLAALALVALSPAAHAEETSPRASRHAHTRKGRHRRAKLDDHAGRAPRGGAAPGHEPLVKAKHAAVERPESIGSPNDGHLRGGVQLDTSHHYVHVLPASEWDGARWGLPVMVNMIDRAAREVAKRFPGAVLDVGDISQKGGGDLLRHHSHESGRDADLGFYAMDGKGKQVHGRTFAKFDPSLASPNYPGARFDLPRNWTFVQALLTDPAARVSHIFVAEWLRKELLAYARPRVSRALWDRAAVVMMQPHHSLPHDDHFHARISCPHEDHGSCIELAKVAPHGHLRVAQKTHSGGHPLKTPGAHHAPGPHAIKPPPASAAAPQDPFTLPTPDPTPAVDDVDTDADAKDEVDEAGSPKITD